MSPRCRMWLCSTPTDREFNDDEMLRGAKTTRSVTPWGRGRSFQIEFRDCRSKILWRLRQYREFCQIRPPREILKANK